jgi:hypothetical protein
MVAVGLTGHVAPVHHVESDIAAASRMARLQALMTSPGHGLSIPRTLQFSAPKIVDD